MSSRLSPVVLNIDLGELADEAEELYQYADIANIACGGHAGDEASMALAIERCLRWRVSLGAHPGYPDREGFGRRELGLAPGAISTAVQQQCASLRVSARARGAQVQFVKAHGALYHRLTQDDLGARAFLDGVTAALGTKEDWAVLGPPTGALAIRARAMGRSYLREAFVDRGYAPDGSLLPRSAPGALVTDPAEAVRAARRFAEGEVAETVCVHGDGPAAIAIARAVAGSLRGDGLE